MNQSGLIFGPIGQSVTEWCAAGEEKTFDLAIGTGEQPVVRIQRD
jgi:hypothetical protein